MEKNPLTPEENKKADILCIISVVCALAPTSSFMKLFSINQWVCLLLFMIAGGKISYDKRKNDSKNGRV